MVRTYSGQLAAIVGQAAPSLQAVVSPPSTRLDAAPYREAILRSQPTVADLSREFDRAKNVKAGDPRSTVKDMVSEFLYRPVTKLSDFKSLLIVDESISTGKSVAALLQHLYANGLSQECQITVAVWAKLGPRTEATPA
ncbi:phosphoribosyltransferase [Xanthobacter flavus]|uniref:phosphoribosyltransferase n=1 Tax=Xanthobacter flavus TaxID=281 RepID=UPI00372BBD99